MAKTSNAKPRPGSTAGAEADKGQRPGWLIPAVIGAVVVALFAVAFVVSRAGSGDSVDGDLVQVRPVQVSGAALPDLQKGVSDPAIGMTAPTVSGASFDGRPVQLGGSGRPTMIFFVAHWCPHCRREVPELAPALGRITPPGVEVLTVATATRVNDPNYPPSKWLRKEKWPTTVLADDAAGSAAKAYGLSGYPFYVLIGADGKVVGRGSGEKPVAEIEGLLKQVAPPGG